MLTKPSPIGDSQEGGPAGGACWWTAPCQARSSLPHDRPPPPKIKVSLLTLLFTCPMHRDHSVPYSLIPLQAKMVFVTPLLKNPFTGGLSRPGHVTEPWFQVQHARIPSRFWSHGSGPAAALSPHLSFVTKSYLRRSLI